MRRWAASLLLLLIALLPVQALIVNAQQEANLPACCRRNGVHHCMMPRSMRAEMALLSIGQPSFTPPPCPWKPVPVPALAATVISPFRLISQPAPLAGLIASRSIPSFCQPARSQSTRGPPAVIL